MILRKLILNSLWFLAINLSYAQTETVSIYGELHELSKEVQTVEHVSVFVCKGIDTIAQALSDEDGKFSINLDLQIGDQLKLITQHEDFLLNEILFNIQDDSTENYFFDLSMTRVLVEHGPNIPVYELNEINNFKEFEVNLLAELLSDHPLLCIEFTHYRNPNEPESIGQKRNTHFREYLVSQNVPTEQIIINDTIGVLDCELINDCRAKTYGAVYSLDGNCK